jgi:hypothetical protein
MTVLHQPKNYRAIMVSSTFSDLEVHRHKLIEAIQKFGPKANVMEFDGARAGANVIESSLNMVRDSSAYIGVIGRKYGQTPFDLQLNPNRMSLTELEFNEAIKLGRPILLFIMGEKHPLTEADVELDADKRKKLDAFRERAKRIGDSSEVERLYERFDSLEQFSAAAAIAVGRLAQYLDGSSNERKTAGSDTNVLEDDTILPRPPNLAALPRYIGSHPFIGRALELQTLTDWCSSVDPNPMLLFEAIGGSGKSMLTWEWLNNHATRARDDWAGRFWYSFYEKGAVMADFCREALAYVAAKPTKDLTKLRTRELSNLLVSELERRPWLLVLDGLERILVAYHRHDAAQLPDEDADTTGDQIGKRNPCASIRPEDDELLRRLAAVAPSKIIISSRLTPKALMNHSGTPLPGVRREILSGLRPSDAEAMIRACRVRGNSKKIQSFLKTNCDCHPLVIGALAGLVNNYPHDRGDFDSWEKDLHYGGSLNLAKLDLIQRRNHILFAAIDALAQVSRQLLQTLALMQGGANFETLEAFNPHLRGFNTAGSNEHAKLWETVRDLEDRGLLQYELSGKRYDLHPVVRGVTIGRMRGDETQRFGQKVVNYFIGQTHNPWKQAETLEDIAPGLQVVRVFISMQRYKDALEAYRGDLSLAMLFNLGAHSEVQALLKPFFPNGWGEKPIPLNGSDLIYVLNEAAVSLHSAFPEQAWKLLERSIELELRESESDQVATGLTNLAWISWNNNKLAEAVRLRSLALKVGEGLRDDEEVFLGKLSLFAASVECGDRKTTDRLWDGLGLRRTWSPTRYRPGDAEKYFARHLFYCGELTEDVLLHAETLAKNGRNRSVIQELQAVRGAWMLTSGEPAGAIDNLTQAVQMAREVAREDIHSEALLALARLRAGISFDVRAEAERLANTTGNVALVLADIWLALGDRDRVVEQALLAHDWAVADGEPYVRRHQLERARGLLTELGVTPPDVPRYNRSKAVRYPWEEAILMLIDRLHRQASSLKRVAAIQQQGKVYRND